MIGIMIVAHSGLGESLIRCATHMFGSAPERCISIPLESHDDIARLLPRIEICIEELNQGQGVLVLTDMIGGTPCNTIMPFISAGHVEALSGVNLPMLVRAINYRDLPLANVVQKVVCGGQESIVQLEAIPNNENSIDR